MCVHICVWLFDCQLIAVYHLTTSCPSQSSYPSLSVTDTTSISSFHNAAHACYLPACSNYSFLPFFPPANFLLGYRSLLISPCPLLHPPFFPLIHPLSLLPVMSLSLCPSSVSLSHPPFPFLPLLFLHFPSPPSLCSPPLCTLYRELRPQVLPRPLPHPHLHQQQQE